MSIRIDKEFESLIPPLTDEEFKQLEENIVREGIRDPLVVWHVPNGDDILIDGHNRWKIAAKHAGIRFDINRKNFPDRDAVAEWICNNQLGRRNLNILDREKLMDKKREIAKKRARERQATSTGGSKPQLMERLPQAEKGSVRDIIGKELGISGRQVDKLHAINQKASEEVKQAVRTGEMSVNQAYNSLRPKQQDPVKQAKQEHEEFQTKKSDGIVNFKDVQIDKINQDIIGNSLLQEVLKLINEVDKFAMIHKTEELKTLTTAVKDDERGIIADKCKTGRMTLQIIENYIRGI